MPGGRTHGQSPTRLHAQAGHELVSVLLCANCCAVCGWPDLHTQQQCAAAAAVGVSSPTCAHCSLEEPVRHPGHGPCYQGQVVYEAACIGQQAHSKQIKGEVLAGAQQGPLEAVGWNCPPEVSYCEAGLLGAGPAAHSSMLHFERFVRGAAVCGRVSLAGPQRNAGEQTRQPGGLWQPGCGADFPACYALSAGTWSSKLTAALFAEGVLHQKSSHMQKCPESGAWSWVLDQCVQCQQLLPPRPDQADTKLDCCATAAWVQNEFPDNEASHLHMSQLDGGQPGARTPVGRCMHGSRRTMADSLSCGVARQGSPLLSHGTRLVVAGAGPD